MGIAWMDDDPGAEAEPDLRFGGNPLLQESVAWPSCPSHGTPMLFRCQVPLALTALVQFDDPRIVSIFECQNPEPRGPSRCGGGCALLVDGNDLALRRPPQTVSFDVVLESFGTNPESVHQTLRALEVDLPKQLPAVLLEAVPPSIGEATAATLSAAGALASVHASPPTVLTPARGGRLVPFEDELVGMRRTTLPPLEDLVTDGEFAAMRGVLGSGSRGYRDHAYRCSCGKPTRTAMRLLESPSNDPRIHLGPAHVQVCTACGTASLHCAPHPSNQQTVRNEV